MAQKKPLKKYYLTKYGIKVPFRQERIKEICKRFN